MAVAEVPGAYVPCPIVTVITRAEGVGVGLGVAVRIGAGVAVAVDVGKTVSVGVAAALAVAVGVSAGRMVAVGLTGVAVGRGPLLSTRARCARCADCRPRLWPKIRCTEPGATPGYS